MVAMAISVLTFVLLLPRIEKNGQITKREPYMAWDLKPTLNFEPLDRSIRPRRSGAVEHVLVALMTHNARNQKLVRPLQAEVKKRKLWACHLGPDLGGPGYGQLKLGLINEILGRARFAPVVFGTQAPDTGNAEILAHYGTPEQKKQFLEPLPNNEIVSCFSMPESYVGVAPKMFIFRAELQGNVWVINGE
jgi:acyl-CoA dehydrogenase